MKTVYMIRRKTDGLFHTGNFSPPAKVGKPYQTKGSCKNGWNAMKSRSWMKTPNDYELVEFELTERASEPLT